MLDVCLLGTGGTMPLKNRWLTSALFRSAGKSLMIDCGEGTQIAMKHSGFTFKPLGVLCITHFHADHISGLPGLLLSMGNEGRQEPLTIIGPRGLTRVVNALRIIAPGLPFGIKLIEIDEPEKTVELDGFVITAFHVRHTVECLGYRIELRRAGRFDVEKAQRYNVPKKIWSVLQKNERAEADGVTYTQDMVLGAARKGIKAVYATDTRPTESIVRNAEDADLLICEGMYGDPEKQARAEETYHMMYHEAAQLAKDARAKRLWLTHYSPSLTDEKEFLGEAARIFPGTKACKDGEMITIRFED
ncbi:MAG: ribonuclease Z [bacterium]|nr:ribonuclease Z [bacterium]